MPSKKPVVEKKTVSKKKPAAKTVKAAVGKSAAKSKPAAKGKSAAKAQSAKPEPKAAIAHSKIESLLMIPGAKFLKIPFFFDAEKRENSVKHLVRQKLQEEPTAYSRSKISNAMDGKNLVELLSQQLEFENKTYFEGCEGQVCVKCNVNSVDAKFYVDKSLGYCTECAMLLGLGQSKEGVFSDAQMELMRRSMEKSMENTKDMDEDDIESALGEMDSLELEEALLAVEEEAAEFNA